MYGHEEGEFILVTAYERQTKKKIVILPPRDKKLFLAYKLLRIMCHIPLLKSASVTSQIVWKEKKLPGYCKQT